MPPRRSPIYVAVLVVSLLGLSSYLTLTVFAGGGEDFVFPVDVPIVEAVPEDPAELATAALESIALDLEVTLRPRLRILPPAGAVTPFCRLVAGDKVLQAPATFVAGPRAADPSRRVRGRHLLRFDLGAGRARYRIVNMPSGDEVVDVPVGADLFFAGRVLSNRGEPIGGAEVWAGESQAGKLQTVLTDGDGRFSIPVVGGPGVPLTVWAKDWASQYRVVQVGSAPSRDFIFQLEPAALVRVQFGAQVANPERGRVFVLPGGSGTESVKLAMLQYPFFLHGIGAGLRLDSKGGCEIHDLPRDVEVAILVRHPQVASLRPVRHRPGARGGRPVVVQAARGPELRGFVVDSHGKPIVGAVVVSRLASGRIRSTNTLLPTGALELGVSRMTTDGKGAYRIRRPADDCLITATAVDFCGAQILSRRPSDGQEYHFALPSAAAMTGKPMLRLSMPDELRGRQVRIRNERGMGNLRVWTGDSAFEIDLECMALVDIEVVITDRASNQRRRILYQKDLAVLGPVELELHR